MYHKFGVKPKDLRGVGIQLSKLIPKDNKRSSKAVIERFLKPQDSWVKARVCKDPVMSKMTNEKSGKSILRKNALYNSSANDQSTNKYLKKNRLITNYQKEHLYHLSIDKAVFDELPKDIQKQVINDYKINSFNESHDGNKLRLTKDTKLQNSIKLRNMKKLATNSLKTKKSVKFNVKTKNFLKNCSSQVINYTV